jgi:hypothetical protein
MQLWQLDIHGSAMIIDPTVPGGMVEANKNGFWDFTAVWIS